MKKNIIVNLYYNKGLSKEQIAKELSLPIGKVRSTIFAYRIGLKKSKFVDN